MKKINAVKVEVDGHLFDSQTEAAFYHHLKSRDDVETIIVHRTFTFMHPFEIKCGRCKSGKVKSPKTGNMIKCRRCDGTGLITRKAWQYTPDFIVEWKDGETSYYDVKGGFKNERFNLVKKMFEKMFGQELLVVKLDKGKWKYM